MARLFLTACVGLMLGWLHHELSATETGFLDFDNLPETNFSCEGKVIGGYYADTETGCQMFHVCTIGQKGKTNENAGEVTDIKFLCLNGTVFDQETRVCERLDEVDCSKSESFYDLNLELYGNHASFGIQPENEETQDAQLCEEEDEEECKTEKLVTQAKQEQSQSDEDVDEEEEATTQPPQLTPSTSGAPVTTTSYPTSTSSTPQVIQFPSSSPETIVALLALHKAFTQSLQQHSDKDIKVNPPKLTGFVETLDPEKAIQQVETFEIKSSPTLPPSRIPAPFVPKIQTQFSQSLPKTQFQSPLKPQYQSPLKTQYQSQPKPQYQSPPKPQYQSPPKPIYQSPPKPQYQSPPKPQYQSPPKTLYQEPQKPQFQNPPKPQFSSIPKPPPPLPLPPITYSKPIQTTSESYGTGAYHHSFHINNQHQSFPDQNYQDQYSYHDSPSSQTQTEAPKQYDFDYEDDYYDEKPHSSTITPYILHQLKVNQVQNSNQAKITSVSHGNFVREVSSPTQNKPFNTPSFRSVTTPGIAIITATSTTSSSSVKTSKPTPSAILTSKNSPSAAGFADFHVLVASPNSTQLPDPPQSYDEYNESDVRSDPFYKDVPKISRTKRYLKDSIVIDNSLTLGDYKTLGITKLRDRLIDRVFNNNSELVLNAVLNRYCKDQVNSSDSLVRNCFPGKTSKLFSDSKLGDNWKIVIPNANSDYLYLYKTILSSNNYQNSTSNVLLLVNFPDEFKVIRNSLIKNLERELKIKDVVNNVDMLSSVNSLIHHRFKRVKRNRLKTVTDRSNSKNKLSEEEHFLKAQQRNKRQVDSSQTYENTDLKRNLQRENYPVQRRSNASRKRLNNGQELSNVDSEIRRPSQRFNSQTRNENTSEIQLQMPSRSRQRRPITRHQVTPNIPLNLQVTSIPMSTNLEPSTISAHRSRVRVTPLVESDITAKERTYSRNRGEGKNNFRDNAPLKEELNQQAELDEEVEVSTTYPFNLQPGSTFTCDDKIKGGYYADVEAQCYGYFICSQGEINGPLLKSHFWCGPATKFNQRSRTCLAEANVECPVSTRYFHLNKDILSLPDLPTTENPLPPDPFFDEVPKLKRQKRSNGMSISNSSKVVGSKNLIKENFTKPNTKKNLMLNKKVSKNLTRTKRQLILQESNENTTERRVPQTRRVVKRVRTNPFEEEHTQITKIQHDNLGSLTISDTPRRQNVILRRKHSEIRTTIVPQVPPENTEKTHNTENVKFRQDHKPVKTSFVDNQEVSKNGAPTPQNRGRGRKYQFVDDPLVKKAAEEYEETSTALPLNLQPGTKFTCDDKIKGGYYADVEADCYGYFICSQGEINGPLLKSHFWCGPTTKFNQRSRTCQVEANVACSVSTIYFHQNIDILSLPDPTTKKPDQMIHEMPKVRRQKRSHGIYSSNYSTVTEPTSAQDKLNRYLKKINKLKKSRRKKRVKRQVGLEESEGSTSRRRLSSSRQGILRERADQTERENSETTKRQQNPGSSASSDTPRRKSVILRHRIPGQQKDLKSTADSTERTHNAGDVKFRQDHTHLTTSIVDNQEVSMNGDPSSDTPRRQSVTLRHRIPARRQQDLQSTADDTERTHNADNVKFRQDQKHLTTSIVDNQEVSTKGAPTPQNRGRGRKYQFVDDPLVKRPAEEYNEASTPLPLNLQPGTKFTCDDKIKGGYYADVEADCYGYFICSQGEINGPLLKSHFWCGPTTKFNQRSRTCQVEANVACSVSTIYFHQNKDILSLPDPTTKRPDQMIHEMPKVRRQKRSHGIYSSNSSTATEPNSAQDKLNSYLKKMHKLKKSRRKKRVKRQVVLEEPKGSTSRRRLPSSRQGILRERADQTERENSETTKRQQNPGSSASSDTPRRQNVILRRRIPGQQKDLKSTADSTERTHNTGDVKFRQDHTHLTTSFVDNQEVSTKGDLSSDTPRRQSVTLRHRIPARGQQDIQSTADDTERTDNADNVKFRQDQKHLTTSIVDNQEVSTKGPPTPQNRGRGRKYQFVDDPLVKRPAEEYEEASTPLPLNLQPGTKFKCDDKIKGGYYADVEADCYGYFICSQGEINGPLLKSHFWCGPTTKFNQRSRTCQVETNVACSVSERYFHLNKDILSLSDTEGDSKDSFEPAKVQS